MSHPSGYGMGMFYAVLRYGKFESLFEKGIGVVCWSRRIEALLRLGHRFVRQYAPSPRLASTRLFGAAIAKPFFKQAPRIRKVMI